MTTANFPTRRPSIRIDARHQLADLMQSQVDFIASAKIVVSVLDSGVHLQGSVNSWYDKQRAQERIRGVTSAFRVHNELRVGGG